MISTEVESSRKQQERVEQIVVQQVLQRKDVTAPGQLQEATQSLELLKNASIIAERDEIESRHELDEMKESMKKARAEFDQLCQQREEYRERIRVTKQAHENNMRDISASKIALDALEREIASLRIDMASAEPDVSRWVQSVRTMEEALCTRVQALEESARPLLQRVMEVVEAASKDRSEQIERLRAMLNEKMQRMVEYQQIIEDKNHMIKTLEFKLEKRAAEDEESRDVRKRTRVDDEERGKPLPPADAVAEEEGVAALPAAGEEGAAALPAGAAGEEDAAALPVAGEEDVAALPAAGEEGAAALPPVALPAAAAGAPEDDSQSIRSSSALSTRSQQEQKQHLVDTLLRMNEKMLRDMDFAWIRMVCTKLGIGIRSRKKSDAVADVMTLIESLRAKNAQGAGDVRVDE